MWGARDNGVSSTIITLEIWKIILINDHVIFYLLSATITKIQYTPVSMAERWKGNETINH